MFKEVIIHPDCFKRNERYICDNETGYLEYLKDHQGMCESIGGYKQYIKPIFDIDAYATDIDIKTYKIKINSLFPNKPIYYGKRDPRDTKKGIKYSYRFYVGGVKIYYTKMKELLIYNKFNEDKFVDMSIYCENKVLFLPKTTKKDRALAPELKIIEGSIFDCCASYIEETYEDWNPIVDNLIEKIKGEQIINHLKTIECDYIENDDENDAEERKSDAFYNIFKNHIKALKNERANDYADWLEVIMCIVNIGKKYKWGTDRILELCDLFSQKNEMSYDKCDNEKKIYGLLSNDREVKVGYKRFLDCLREDNPDYFRKHIVGSYKDVKKRFEEEYCIINNPCCFYRTPKNLPRVITEDSDFGEINQMIVRSDLIHQTESLMCNVRCEDKKGKVSFEKKRFINKWLEDCERLTYEGIVFRPRGLTKDEMPYYKNLFTGFKADKINLDDEIINYDDIQPILDHIKIVYCDNNDEHYQYVLNWFSRIVTNPENRPQIGLVFFNKNHGTGRNSFTNYFINYILGIDLCVSAHNINRIFGKFNSILSKCMFLVIEEASGELKKFMEDMKNLITEPTITIEKKNIDSGTYKNYVNPILLTNNEDVLDIDDKDRRFAIFKSSDCMKNNEEYFNRLYKCMGIRKNAGIFIKYLREEINCSWSPMEFSKYRPITKAYKKQQSVNAKNYIKFVSHIISDSGIELSCHYKWVKYAGVVSSTIKENEVYIYYKHICELYKYQAYPYDKFINNLIQENTGITRVLKYRYKYLKFDKICCEKWVEIFRNTQDEDIEVYDETLEEPYEYTYEEK